MGMFRSTANTQVQRQIPYDLLELADAWAFIGKQMAWNL